VVSSGSPLKRLPKQAIELPQIAGFALPDDPDLPCQLPKRFSDLLIPRDVPLELALPEWNAGLGRIGESARIMPVPEAAVNEKNGMVTREDDIWLSGEIGPV
jgi:hypothetical protein